LHAERHLRLVVDKDQLAILGSQHLELGIRHWDSPDSFFDEGRQLGV
jgi:hypothetical protein